MPTRRLYQEFWMSVCVTHIFTPISFQKIGLKLKFYDRITNLCSFHFVKGFYVGSSHDPNSSNFTKCQMWRGLDWNILLCGSLPWGVPGQILDLSSCTYYRKAVFFIFLSTKIRNTYQPTSSCNSFVFILGPKIVLVLR